MKDIFGISYDEALKLIESSNNRIKTALIIEKNCGREFLMALFVKAIEDSKIDVSNSIYKAILFGKFHRVNMFVEACQRGNGDSFLESMSISEKQLLAEDIASKMQMYGKTFEDIDSLWILNNSIISSLNQSEEQSCKLGQ